MLLLKTINVSIATVLLAASMGVQAEPYFTNKEGNLIWDQATDRVWMRCSLGQTWNGDTCSGKASTLNWKGAQEAAKTINNSGGYAGVTDWQVPSARALAMLRKCSKGFRTPSPFVGHLLTVEENQPPVPAACEDGSDSPTIDTDAFPVQGNPDFWSTTLNWKERGVAPFSVSLYKGAFYTTTLVDENYRNVLLVRNTLVSESEAALTFPVNVHDSVERKYKAQRAEEHAKREAEERLTQANRAKAIKQLLALGARGLYVEAGKAQRNGAQTIVNTRFDAAELYEMIVNKFPDSEYAVKATDQLTAMSRSSSERAAAEQANSSARQRAYNACKIEVNSCYSRTNGKGNCYRDCDSLL